MKNAAYYRAVARELMADRWKSFGLGFFLLELITLALSFVPYVGTFARLLVSGAFSLSIAQTSLRFINGQDVCVGNIFDGFKNYVKATVLYLHQSIVVFLWMLLFIVPGLIKSYSYFFVFHILAENPDMSSKEAMEESRCLTDGHKAELFKLQFSFIGWFFMSILTLGILGLWSAPYMHIATTVFYTDLKMAKYGTADPYGVRTEERFTVSVDGTPSQE